jgi:two-component system, sensor histidine kinase and response regulator
MGRSTVVTSFERSPDPMVADRIASAEERLRIATQLSGVSIWSYELAGRELAHSTVSDPQNEWEPRPGDSGAAHDLESRIAHTVLPEDQSRVAAALGACIDGTTERFDAEYRVRHDDGTITWRLARGVVIRDHAGAPIRISGTSLDVTRVKEAAAAASRAKDEFLANVSHEIRTPMNAILGMTELALDSAPSEHHRQMLSTVRSAAKSLLTIINDLLDFSKIASGKLSLDRADFSLRAAVGDTMRALAVRAHRKGLELLCHVLPEVPDALAGDAGRLRQVLMNLVGNAIKFTQQGEVEVGVESSPTPDGRVALVFTVRDTGIGIAREKQATIFNAFEQEDASTTRKYGGTGLGLTISAQLASLMDGNITVASEPGFGSTFRFTARFARSARPDSSAVSAERLSSLEVLVVDDHEANRRILIEWLTSWRMRPTPASDAREALAAIERSFAAGAPFSLVLLDARMPDTDGVTLAGEIRRRWQHRAPRSILLSSDDNPDLSVQARQAGVLAYLIKPVQQSELLESIWAVMNLAFEVPPSAGPVGQHRSSFSPRVLVAEDNALNITLLKALLERRGYSVEFAHDGRRAVELAIEGGFDLVLLDLHLPELDGFEVARRIREHEAGTDRHLPIIALTARSSGRDRERCLAAGMDEFLAKPIEAGPLLAAIDHLISDLPPTPQPAAAGESLLDPRAILRACGGQADVFEQLRVVFRRNLPVLMDEVHAAMRVGDLSAVREGAHQLVGTIGAFSTAAADLASILEDAATAGDRDGCAALVEKLALSCEALLEATATLTLRSLSL